MGKKQLVRDVKAAALARLEDAARTAADFEIVVKQWDKLDENRERRERFHEMNRDEEVIGLGYTDGLVLPPPLIHPAWREVMLGEFIEMIYDSADEMWQLVENQEIAAQLKTLTDKQKEVLFLRAIRLCTPQQIACFQEITDRAVRKLLAITLGIIRGNLGLDKSKLE